MRALVTGAATVLGRAAISALAGSPDVDLVVAAAPDRVPDLPCSVVFEPADLRHTRGVHDLVWQAAARHRIDTVLHLGCGHVTAKHVVTARQLVLRCAEHPTIRRFIYRSFAEVYAAEPAGAGLLDEDAALDLAPSAPAWLRDRIAADIAVTHHLGGRLEIAVLRLAEILAPDSGSPLWSYLASRLCLRPLGFDPMINVLALEDAVTALLLAARSREVGVFNIPGADTLPLSCAITEAGRAQLPVPGFALRHDAQRRRLRDNALLDGARARRLLGYVPHHRVRWPRPWWRELLERLARR